MRPDLVRLSELGLTTSDIGIMVRAAGDGAIIDEYHLDGEAIDLKVIARESVGQTTIMGIEDIPIATPSGQIVPLGSIAEIRRVGAPSEIARVGRQRSVSFEVNPAPNVPLELAMTRLEELIVSLREKGVIFIDDPEEVPPGSLLVSLPTQLSTA